MRALASLLMLCVVAAAAPCQRVPERAMWGAFAVVKDSDQVFVIWESRWFALTRL